MCLWIACCYVWGIMVASLFKCLVVFLVEGVGLVIAFAGLFGLVFGLCLVGGVFVMV